MLTSNIQSSSMEARFHRMSFHGSKTKYKMLDSENILLDETVTDALIDPDHIQGYARYTTPNNVSYDIYCRSDRENRERKGWLTICNKDRSFVFRTPEKEFNHPGGMQIVDNFLFVPVEKGKNDAEDKDRKSYICIYNLLPLDDKKPPVLIKDFRPCFSHKAGMLGVQKIAVDNGTNWVFGIHDNNTFYLYYATENPKFVSGDSDETAPCAEPLTEIFHVTDTNYDFQNLNLIYDEGKLYLFGFRSVGTNYDFGQPTSFDDYVALYEVVFSFPSATKKTESKSNNNYIKLIAEKHFITNATEWVISSLDIHFRFGAGVTYSAEKGLEMYATARNLIRGYFCYDTFTEGATITAEAKPSNSKRCSDNFTINWENGYNVEFEVFDKESGIQIEATFCIIEDESAAIDTYQWKNVQNNETRVWMDGKKSNLYIAELKRADGKKDAVKIYIQPSGMPCVSCTRKPYEGQKERASYNFSTERLPRTVLVRAYENYGTLKVIESDACFIIKEDKDDTDPVLYEKVKHGTKIEDIIRTKSAYIAFPEGVTADKNFTVLFEEITP